MQTVKVLGKGQVVIPASIRKKHGIQPGCEIQVFEYENLIGFYGVGTRKRFRRQGYATKIMSNYMSEILDKSPNRQFCLQAQNNSGAEELYLNLGFEIPFIQKRFDWDPSTKSLSL